MQPESAEPVQDAVRFWSAGLTLAQRLGLGLRAVLGVRQSLGLGSRWEKVLLSSGLVEVVLGGRVRGRGHLGRRVTGGSYGTLGG